MKTAFLFISLLISSYCYSQDWQFVYEDDKQTIYFKPKDLNTIWVKWFSEETKYANENGVERIVDGYKILLWKIDCKALKSGILKSTTYDKEGNALFSYSISELSVDMEYSTPDSIGEFILTKACKK